MLSFLLSPYASGFCLVDTLYACEKPVVNKGPSAQRGDALVKMDLSGTVSPFRAEQGTSLETPWRCSANAGGWVQSLVRELDPTRYN